MVGGQHPTTPPLLRSKSFSIIDVILWMLWNSSLPWPTHPPFLRPHQLCFVHVLFLHTPITTFLPFTHHWLTKKAARSRGQTAVFECAPATIIALPLRTPQRELRSVECAPWTSYGLWSANCGPRCVWMCVCICVCVWAHDSETNLYSCVYNTNIQMFYVHIWWIIYSFMV